MHSMRCQATLVQGSLGCSKQLPYNREEAFSIRAFLPTEHHADTGNLPYISTLTTLSCLKIIRDTWQTSAEPWDEAVMGIPGPASPKNSLMRPMWAIPADLC